MSSFSALNDDHSVSQKRRLSSIHDYKGERTENCDSVMMLATLVCRDLDAINS